MTTFTYTPSYSSSVDVQPRIISAPFGEGYELNLEDGINTSAEIWNLTFSNVDLTTSANIVSFFKDYKTCTTPFDWVTPDGNTYRFLCKAWKRNFDSPMTATITATFQQVFW